MTYDEVLNYLGDFGNHQRFVFLLLCSTAVLCGAHALSGVFLLALPQFRCRLPAELNATSVKYSLPTEIWEASYPKENVSGKFQSCEYYTISNISTTKCTSYIYDDSVIVNSAVTEWNLVCDRSWLVATNQALLMIGFLLGSIVFGQLSDKYGRKTSLMSALFVQAISGILASFAPEYISYSIARIFIGSTVMGVFLTGYVLAMEMVGPRHRLFASVALMSSYSLGILLLPVCAYFIGSWRHLQIALSLPGLIFMSYKYIIPESTRWLLLQQQTDLAVARIRKLARRNSIELRPDLLETLLDEFRKPNARIISNNDQCNQDQDQKLKLTIIDLLKLPNMRHKSIQIFLNWFVITATYYGLSWNTQLLHDNIFLSFALNTIVEIPAHCSLLLMLNRFGRRIVLCGSLLLSGIGLLLASSVSHDMNWLIISFSMMGKFGITASFGSIYIFSAEQFPTAVRNIGMGASSVAARIGGILAPYLYLLSQIWHPLPLIICGVLTFLAGSLTFLLPETLNRPTLETLADGENFTRKRAKRNKQRDENELNSMS